MLQNESFKIQMAHIQIVNDYRSPGTPANDYGEMSSDWDFSSCGYRSAQTVQFGPILYCIVCLHTPLPFHVSLLLRMNLTSYNHNFFTIVSQSLIFTTFLKTSVIQSLAKP